MSSGGDKWTRIFLRNLPSNYSEGDIRALLSQFTSLQTINVKNTYAYVYLSDRNEVETFLDRFQGKDIDGKNLQIQIVNDQREFVPPNFALRIRVFDIPAETTWKDLKDWSRNAGPVQYSNILKKGSIFHGLLEFKTKESYDAAFEILPNIPIDGKLVTIANVRI